MQIWRLAGYIAGGIAVFGASFFVSLRVIDWMADVAGVVCSRLPLIRMTPVGRIIRCGLLFRERRSATA